MAPFFVFKAGMGLFSGKDTTQVGTQVQRIIEDKNLPRSVRDGVVKNLFDAEGGGDQMMEYVLDELANSIGLRAGRMYEYGKRGYLFGLPQASLHSSQAGRDASKAAIAYQLSMAVDLSYYHFGPLNNLHLAWMVLVRDHNYDARTNEFGINGGTVFLTNMQIVVTPATLEKSTNGSLDQWGVAPNAGPSPARAGIGLAQANPTPFAVDPAAAGDYVRVDYAWREATTTQVEGIDVTQQVLKTASFQIPITGYDMQADYHQARYVTGAGQVGYWIYQEGTGALPAVDAVFAAAYDGSGSFFPFGYFRFNKKSAIADTSTAEFASSKKLFDYLNMDFETVAAGINSNPDIDNVEQAMMMMAVPAVTSNPLEQRYLFDFFNGIQTSTIDYSNNVDLPEIFGISLKMNPVTEATSIIIQDKRFKMALSYTSISKRRVGGILGPVDTYASGTNADDVMHSVPMVGGGSLNFNSSTPYHWYRHQISDSVYEEVVVSNLKMTYWIFENYTTVGDGTDPILMIPVDIAITEQYSVPDREELYARALHYIFNSRVVTHLAWYQTGVFRGILLIAAIVITVMSGGAAWESIVAAAALGATALSYLLLQMALRYILINLAVRLFVRVVGVKFALIAAIVAAIAGSYQAIEAGSIAGAPWAKELLTVSSSLGQGVSKEVQSAFDDLLGAETQFEQYVKDQTKLLETAESLLDGSKLDPLLIFGESPNDFYQRTVHSGNIGVLGIDAVSSYVDIALQLPKLSQTLGDPSYV